jgi:hypothetical protein
MAAIVAEVAADDRFVKEFADDFDISPILLKEALYELADYVNTELRECAT